ncbi:hypothetical protein V6N12_044945 [Hibiscus sabdariffa]|uniref:Uncharacterized protein n=1 Tax=Hibiscus sabdariffa TaxID=183260 RepID=A0ABR2G1A0_9ROSI
MKKLLENSSVPYELSYVHELVEVFPDDLALKGVSEARGDLCPGSSVDIVDAVPVSDPVVYAVGVADAAVCAASCEDSVTDVVVCAVVTTLVRDFNIVGASHESSVRLASHYLLEDLLSSQLSACAAKELEKDIT